MGECLFCGKEAKRLFTWGISNCKAEIYLAEDDTDQAKDLIVFEGDWGRISAIKISYCPFCGSKISKGKQATA